MSESDRRRYGFACEALVGAVRTAADPTVPEWAAYRGHTIGIAYFYAKYVMREARMLGLYPSTMTLAREECEATL